MLQKRPHSAAARNSRADGNLRSKGRAATPRNAKRPQSASGLRTNGAHVSRLNGRLSSSLYVATMPQQETQIVAETSNDETFYPSAQGLRNVTHITASLFESDNLSLHSNQTTRVSPHSGKFGLALRPSPPPNRKHRYTSSRSSSSVQTVPVARTSPRSRGSRSSNSGSIASCMPKHFTDNGPSTTMSLWDMFRQTQKQLM